MSHHKTLLHRHKLTSEAGRDACTFRGRRDALAKVPVQGHALEGAGAGGRAVNKETKTREFFYLFIYFN